MLTRRSGLAAFFLAVGASLLATLVNAPLSWSKDATDKSAAQIRVPLTVPGPYLTARAAAELGLDKNGQGELVLDPCKRLELADLLMQPNAGELQLEVNLRAHAGLMMFGRCRGPDPVDARLVLQLMPTVDEAGDAVIFRATAAELRDLNGEASLLTVPSRALAESLLLPRLESMRVDVADALASIDDLIERFLKPPDDGGSRLADHGHLVSVASVANAMQVELAFSVLKNPESALAEAPVVDNVVADLDPQPESQAQPASEAEFGPVDAFSDDEILQWQRVEDELDGFLTVIVTKLAAQTEDMDLRFDLLALLIETRAQIAVLLSEDATGIDTPSRGAEDRDGNAAEPRGDPLRELFLVTWSDLSRIATQLPVTDTRQESGLRLASFLAAGDALQLADALGPDYGLEISKDGLRRLARLLLSGSAPISFTPLPLAPDEEFRRVFGFLTLTARDTPSARLEVDASNVSESPVPGGWLAYLNPIASARAAEPSPAQLLRRVFPQRATLESYLSIVAALIAQTLESHWEDSRLDVEQRALFEPLVRATAWKETCWRHYLPGDDEVMVIKSSIGAVGMMQIVGRVWRSMFDITRLEEDVEYNLASGIEILEHYFLHYAVRRGEHKQPGGADNLVKATYAAYNGGPSKLSRYRREGVSSRARAVDRQFYTQYLTMREMTWPRESRCYVN